MFPENLFLHVYFINILKFVDVSKNLLREPAILATIHLSNFSKNSTKLIYSLEFNSMSSFQNIISYQCLQNQF